MRWTGVRPTPDGGVRVSRNGRLVRTRNLLSSNTILLENGTAPLRIGTQDLDGSLREAIGEVAPHNREPPASRVPAHHRAMISPMWAQTTDGNTAKSSAGFPNVSPPSPAAARRTRAGSRAGTHGPSGCPGGSGGMRL